MRVYGVFCLNLLLLCNVGDGLPPFVSIINACELVRAKECHKLKLYAITWGRVISTDIKDRVSWGTSSCLTLALIQPYLSAFA
jgi:hypothetical protein